MASNEEEGDRYLEFLEALDWSELEPGDNVLVDGTPWKVVCKLPDGRYTLSFFDDPYVRTSVERGEITPINLVEDLDTDFGEE